MSKNNMMVLSIAALLLSAMTRVVSADIAPDRVTRSPSVLVIVLIAAVVIVAVLLIKKFFSK